MSISAQCLNSVLNLLSSCLVLAISAVSQTEPPVVMTTSGAVRGKTIYHDDGLVKAWLGIPFATPPVGPLRFKPALEVPPWEGIRDALTQPPGCYQTDDTSYNVVPTSHMWSPTNMSEDCLYLNIYVPGNNVIQQYPTVVWIHGGAYYKGAISLDMYNPEVLVAREKVVVVSIQYRVAALGFLYLGSSEAPGNVGLLDQTLALEWIKRNIRAFGGSEELTLMGESAGSASVAYHVISKHSWDLFDRGIMQSGSPHSPWGYVDPMEALQLTEYFAGNVGCLVLHQVDMDCLRALPPDQLLAGDQSILYFAPTIDGDFLTEDPRVTAERGDTKKTRILAGLVQNEGMPALEYMLSKLYPADYPHFSEADYAATTFLVQQYLRVSDQNISHLSDYYLDRYGPLGAGRGSWDYLSAAAGLVGDWLVSCGLVDFVLSAVDSGSQVYFYYFNHRSDHSPVQDYMGVMHGDELPYQFGLPWLLQANYTDQDRTLSSTIMRFWMNFVKFGHPVSEPGDHWSSYSRSNYDFKLLETQGKTFVTPRELFCERWNDIRPYINIIKTKDMAWFKMNMVVLVATRRVSGMLNWLSTKYRDFTSLLGSNVLAHVF